MQDFGDAGVFPDQGLTLDAVLAFAAAGSAGNNATAAMTWLGTGTMLLDYVGDGTSFSDAGRLAKGAYAAEVTGGDPHDVAGVDVLGRLSAQLTASGRFSDTPADSDLSNAFGQAFAQLALARTPDGVPAPAVAFLAGSECPGGGFPLDYGQPTCTPDTDATAMAVQALALPGGDAAAAARGLDWLVARQAADGSFTGTGPTATPNANSTGLAAQALRAAGRTGPADAAAGWLRGQQLGCTAPAEQQGAIAYDANGFDPGNVIRATAQAALGLSGVGLAELSLTGAEPDAPTLDCAGSPTPTPPTRGLADRRADHVPDGRPDDAARADDHRAAPAGTVHCGPDDHGRPGAAGLAADPAGLDRGLAAEHRRERAPVLWAGVGLVLLGLVTVFAGRRRRRTP